MAHLNQIQLIGNVGRVDARTLSSGKVVEFSLATTEHYTNRSGEKVEETQWHNVKCYGTMADLMEKYLEKGAPIFLAGKMTYRTYETQSGEKRTIAEVIARDIQFLSKPAGRGESAQAQPSRQAQGAPNPYLAELQAPDRQEDEQGDLPF